MIIAVLISIPAVFLTVWTDGGFAVAGKVIGWVSGAVLWFEAVILLMAAEHKREWLWRHKWMILVCVLTVFTLAFAAGGAQLLRFIYVIGSLRVLRAKRIITAAQVLDRRFGLGVWWRSALFTIAGLIAAVFVAVVLADPTSEYMSLITWFDHNLRLVPILIAGLILAGATWLVVRVRTEEQLDEEEE